MKEGKSMTRFEELTQNIESLAEYLSIENKGDVEACFECHLYNRCDGKETCKNLWIIVLSSEV